MRAQDRTLLASLGFSDPDKKDNRHNAACRYITQPHIANAILARCYPAKAGDRKERGDLVETSEVVNDYNSATLAAPARFEVPISKGEGQYKTTIGFIDVVLPAEIAFKHHRRTRKRDTEGPWSEWTESHESLQRPVGVEVKAGRVDSGDIIRQINLYKEFTWRPYDGIERWVIATLWTPDSAELEQLERECLFHVQIGEGFAAYLESLKGTPFDQAPDVFTV